MHLLMINSGPIRPIPTIPTNTISNGARHLRYTSILYKKSFNFSVKRPLFSSFFCSPMASSSTSVTPSSHLATKLAHPRAISSHFSSNPNSLNISFPLKNGSFKLRRNATSITLKTLFAHDPKAAVVTEDTWEKSVMNSDAPVLVEFYASWCGPCMMVHRIIDEIASEYAGRVSCFILNTDTDFPVAEVYNIMAVPVVLLFKNGERKESVVGTMPKEYYIAAIERILKS
ncbi:hypothetical protein ERO13_A03G188500v2 [Gossypium hirsutum]|uniref:Thioredoxin M3, chloroplastic isoform X2 n=7 Tax=Gossypium TaxID=3633 RepID=A0A1U8MBT2_GOSHI|nr:thioredoxin M3, chloroplastic isoform X2 [Gossypium hirsutum]KAG4209297.1 hypothetical protein ERO13_A03G188500v2 [Gossypium hirsutum]TYH26170.1 hypothetical protein ES288_A03G229500v1 [Gossypium darwinii]